MSLLYKKCSSCGTKINKLQSLKNIYFLKAGERINCPNCNIQYKTNKLISFIGSFYTWGGIWLLLIFLIVSFIDSFHYKLGIEVWLYALLINTIFEFILMLFLPLNKITNKK